MDRPLPSAARRSPAEARSRRPGRRYARARWVILAIGLLQAAYAVAFIHRSSFVVEGRRYFCLFDDAMISLRYAQNWARGYGLVWNAGERVEGYTNPAWTLALGLCERLPLCPAHHCLCVQLLGPLVLGLCLLSAARLARVCGLSSTSAVCVAVLVAMHYNLVFFTLMGMETGAQTALVTWALADGVCAARRRRGSVRALLWFVPAVLVRMDALLLAGVVGAYLLLVVRRGRGRLAVGGAAVTAALGALMLWRHAYYGEWLPNTYYLKLTGWPLPERLAAGLGQTMWTAFQYGAALVFTSFTFLRPHRVPVLLLGAFATALAYQIGVGGDAWPLSRFVIPTTTGLFVVVLLGIETLLRALWGTPARATQWAARLAAVGVCAFGLDAAHWDHCLLCSPPQAVAGNRMNVRLALALERISKPEATVAVTWAGTVPYYSGRRCVDLLGKCDAHIARLPTTSGVRLAGHNKCDWHYSLGTQRPDVIAHLAALESPEIVRDYHPIAVAVDGAEVALFVRNGSPHLCGGQRISFEQAVKTMYRERFGCDLPRDRWTPTRATP